MYIMYIHVSVLLVFDCIVVTRVTKYQTSMIFALTIVSYTLYMFM